MSRWFRYYDEALDDPKVQTLPAETFKAWVNLLCLASRGGGVLPDVAAVAFALRVTEDEASSTIGMLRKKGLLDNAGPTFRPHNWNGRQFKSDVSTERVKRFRNGNSNSDGSADETSVATPPETEQITDTDSSLRSERAPAKTEKRKGTRIGEFAPSIEAAASMGLPRKSAEAEARKFVDYFRAAPREKGIKLDWDATWRNWIRRAMDQLGIAENTPDAAGPMVDRGDTRWEFLVARWERENGSQFPSRAERWPFPAAWLLDANISTRPKSIAELEAELKDPEWLRRKSA